MLGKKRDENGTQVMDSGQQEELVKASAGRHEIARKFEDATKDTLYREWEIFESRYGAVLNLKEDASKVEVKRAIARVKRASMDVRDALKDMGQFKV